MVPTVKEKFPDADVGGSRWFVCLETLTTPKRRTDEPFVLDKKFVGKPKNPVSKRVRIK